MGRRSDLRGRIIAVANADVSATHFQIAQRVGCHPSTVAKHLKGRRRAGPAAAHAADGVSLRPGREPAEVDKRERRGLGTRISDRWRRSSPRAQVLAMAAGFPAFTSAMVGMIAAIPPQPGSAVQSPGVLEGMGYGGLIGAGMGVFMLMCTAVHVAEDQRRWREETGREKPRRPGGKLPAGPWGPPF